MKPIAAAAQALILGAAVLLFAGPLLAEEKPAQTVDMTLVLLDADGKPMKDNFSKPPLKPGEVDPDPACDKCPVMSLGRAAANVLFADFRDEQISGEQKRARGDLAMRLRQDAHAALSADEAALLKRLIGKAYPPLIVMQAYPLLDPNSRPEAVK